jgi:hypothetical protein
LGLSIGIFIISGLLSIFFGKWWLLLTLIIWIFWPALSEWYCSSLEKREKEQQEALKKIKEQDEKDKDRDTESTMVLQMSQDEYEKLHKEGSIVLDGKYPIVLKDVIFTKH